MSWAETKTINSNPQVPLNTLIGYNLDKQNVTDAHTSDLSRDFMTIKDSNVYLRRFDFEVENIDNSKSFPTSNPLGNIKCHIDTGDNFYVISTTNKTLLFHNATTDTLTTLITFDQSTSGIFVDKTSYTDCNFAFYKINENKYIYAGANYMSASSSGNWARKAHWYIVAFDIVDGICTPTVLHSKCNTNSSYSSTTGTVDIYSVTVVNGNYLLFNFYLPTNNGSSFTNEAIYVDLKTNKTATSVSGNSSSYKLPIAKESHSYNTNSPDILNFWWDDDYTFYYTNAIYWNTSTNYVYIYKLTANGTNTQLYFESCYPYHLYNVRKLDDGFMLFFKNTEANQKVYITDKNFNILKKYTNTRTSLNYLLKYCLDGLNSNIDQLLQYPIYGYSSYNRSYSVKDGVLTFTETINDVVRPAVNIETVDDIMEFFDNFFRIEQVHAVGALKDAKIIYDKAVVTELVGDYTKESYGVKCTDDGALYLFTPYEKLLISIGF